MSRRVETVEYIEDVRSFEKHVAIATLVSEAGRYQMVEADLDQLFSSARSVTRTHVEMVLASIRRKIARGEEPTPPSAQVFFSEQSPAVDGAARRLVG